MYERYQLLEEGEEPEITPEEEEATGFSRVIEFFKQVGETIGVQWKKLVEIFKSNDGLLWKVLKTVGWSLDNFAELFSAGYKALETVQKVIFDFRQNDLKNGGHGAPLTPIFHKLLKKRFKIKDVAFLNIGGIVNMTTILNDDNMTGTDIGPGMCLIDRWVRQKSKKNYDENGIIAKSGKVNKIALDQLLENFYEKENILSTGPIQSFDTKYFDFSFVKDLSLEDGAATLTEFTARIIISALKAADHNKEKIILCGGGRKNNFLVEKLKEESRVIKLIDEYGVDGDFVESQAFAYLAIRSYLKLPISFPGTTGVKKPCSAGEIFQA